MIGGSGASLQHRFSAQHWADGINLWLNAVLALNHPLGEQTVCLGFSRIVINIVKICFFKSDIVLKTKIVICRIHDFITKFKIKIDVDKLPT